MVKDEARYLPQWVEYHHLLHGFDRFIIFDNASSEEQNPRRVLAPYGDLIQVIDVPKSLYNTGSGDWVHGELLNVDCEWLWGGCVDEYFHSPSGERVTDILKDFDAPNIASLYVNWLFFNSRGPLDTGLVIERFAYCAHDKNEFVKSIVRPGRYSRFRAHSVDPLPGFVGVNELGHVQHGATANEFTMQRLVIYHYQCMSRREYDVKMNKGQNNVPNAEDVRREGADENWRTMHSDQVNWELRTDAARNGLRVREALLKRYGLI